MLGSTALAYSLIAGVWCVWETEDPGPSQLDKRGEVTPRVPKLAPGRRAQCVHGGGTQERDWLTWVLANNDPILGAMFPSPVKGYPRFELCYLLGGNPQVPVLHPRTLSLKRSVASPHLPTLGHRHIGQGDPLFRSPSENPQK